MRLLDARRLADKLIDQFLEGWSFRFARYRYAAGTCWDGEKIIELSIPHTRANPEPVVEDTIRHEIAHALVGSHLGHDARWRAACAVTGATPRACFRSLAPHLPYHCFCKCGRLYQRKAVRKDRVYLCPRCPNTVLAFTPTDE